MKHIFLGFWEAGPEHLTMVLSVSLRSSYSKKKKKIHTNLDSTTKSMDFFFSSVGA